MSAAYRWRYARAICAFLLVPLLALDGRVAADAGDIAVVVRPDTPVTNLKLKELRGIMLGDQQFWASSQPITLLIRAPGTRERGVVLKVLYNMTEAEFRNYWISKIFRAETTSGPKIVYSNQVANDLIVTLPGAIAFFEAEQVPKGLKILKIDGKLPGDPGYVMK